MSDIGSVHNYATVGLRLWADKRNDHNQRCPCCVCADTRAYLGIPALVPNPYRVMVVPAEKREERES